MTGGTGKKNTGLIAGMVACAVLAVGGIAFGVYGMMQSSQKDSHISDLKVQVADKDGTIAALIVNILLAGFAGSALIIRHAITR